MSGRRNCAERRGELGEREREEMRERSERRVFS